MTELGSDYRQTIYWGWPMKSKVEVARRTSSNSTLNIDKDILSDT